MIWRIEATACLCVLCGTACLAEDAGPQLSVDPHFSIDTGADLAASTAAAVGWGEKRAFGGLADHPVAGPAARLGRTLLFDAPVAWWLGVVEHEVFGHGGRARELGSSAGVHLGSPWGGRDSYATFSAAGLSNDDLLRIYAGGVESNTRAATLLERALVAGQAMRPLELLLVPAQRFVASDYVLRTTPDPEKDPAGFWAERAGGGDVARYLGYLSTRFTGDPGIAPGGSSSVVISQYRRMRRQAVWNALDPGAWLALWSVGRQVATGRDPAPVSLPKAAGRPFLPVFSTDWLPDGSAASLEVIIGAPAGESCERQPGWMSFIARRGRGPGGRFSALGATTDGLWRGDRLQVGGEVEVWDSPVTSIGGGIGTRLEATRGAFVGTFLEIGAKSDGQWPGRPAGVGPFVRVGARLRLEAASRR